MIIVVMGIAGSGKTTVGGLLAERLGIPFVEGDDHHPPENIAKMAAGIALDDDDRRPWLEALAAAITDWAGRGESVVLSCSALRQSHRALLAGANRDVHFVHLDGDAALLRRRLECRRGHFMPASVFDGQMATLERPKGEANVLTVDVGHPPAEIVETIVEALEADEIPSP